VSLAYLYDPEILLPSPEASESLEFWGRFLNWVEDGRFKLGSATYEEFAKMAANPPEVEGFPQHDFWRAYGRYVPRVLPARSAAPDHVLDYTPFLGAAQNVDVLALDVGNLQPGGVVFLGSDASCWPVDCTQPVSTLGVILHVAYENGASDLAAVRSSYRVAGLDTYDDLRGAAKDLFPAIVFSNEAWSSIKSLDGAERDNVGLLVEHLEVLHDEAVRVWKEASANVTRIALLGSFGVNASPENAKTHKNGKAMSAREFTFGKTVRQCEWHTKLHPHTGRIYFAVEAGTVYVGSITRHL